MKIAVTDANIFIDLIEIKLLDLLFLLGLEIHTTQAVYDQMNEEQKVLAEKYVTAQTLIVKSFDSKEILAIAELKFPAGLEIADRTVFYYSSTIQATVLSGDKKLRVFCESKKIEVRGILWLFDNFVSQKLITKASAVDKLQKLLAINNRLPLEECEKRIAKWSSE